MHSRKLAPLNSIKDFFGVGHVNYTQGKNFASYEVRTREDIRVLLNHFKHYPLQTAKRNSLYIFSIVFEMFCKGEDKTINGLKNGGLY